MTDSSFNFIAGWMSADAPHVILRTMRANGWLRDHAPELDRLYGVPQRLEHHPEGDVGTHNELVLEMAARLSRDPRVRYAALVHDLGKGLTPQEHWPRHQGHEDLGVRPGLVLGKRLGVPKEWRRLGALVARYHLRAHKSMSLSPRGLVRFFRDAGFFGRADVFQNFLFACEADARGRAGRQEIPYKEAPFLREAFCAADATVDLRGAQQLHESRIRSVAALGLSRDSGMWK